LLLAELSAASRAGRAGRGPGRAGRAERGELAEPGAVQAEPGAAAVVLLAELSAASWRPGRRLGLGELGRSAGRPGVLAALSRAAI